MYVKRSGKNVVGAVKWPHPDYPEKMDTDHPDYIAYQERAKEPPIESQGRANLKKRPDNAPVTVGDLKAAGLL